MKNALALGQVKEGHDFHFAGWVKFVTQSQSRIRNHSWVDCWREGCDPLSNLLGVEATGHCGQSVRLIMILQRVSS